AVMIDVGANVGLTAAMAATHGATVYAFEPSPSMVVHLRRTIDANNIADRVHLANCGLSDHNGELTFFEDQNSGSASHLVTTSTLARKSDTRVPVQTLDAFIGQNDVPRADLIKIDVEGFEIDVLKGAQGTLQRLQPAALIEFNAFTMVGFRDINPRDLLRAVRETFPFVYKWNGAPVRIETDEDALTFIHDNLVSAGCVDDLYGSFVAIDES
ncbi:MAG: FkbM family methyltransferase, partial [Nisaea sp.]|uniref:FkbM family methyltransferase n=1 Tax=Nisaea sp. TaxID=2024842 RepID=UPI003264CE22